MVYKFTVEAGFLRAELFDRETADEVKSFLRHVADTSVEHRRACILLKIYPLTPLFQGEPHGLMRHVATLPLMPSWKIALLGDTGDFQDTHESIEALAGKFRLNLWVFQDEAEALQWFKDWRERGERRQPQERRQPLEQQDLPTLHLPVEWRRGPERRSGIAPFSEEDSAPAWWHTGPSTKH